MRSNPTMGVNEVAQAMKVKATIVRRVIRDHGLPNPTTSHSETLAFMLANPGMPVAEIAKKRKISNQAVYSIMKRHGLDHHVRDTYSKGVATTSENELEVIVSDAMATCDKEWVLKYNGLPQSMKDELGRKYGVNGRVMTKVSTEILRTLKAERDEQILNDLRLPNRKKDSEIALIHNTSEPYVAKLRRTHGIGRLPRNDTERSAKMRSDVRGYVATNPTATPTDIQREFGINLSQARILLLEVNPSKLPITKQQRQIIENELRKTDRDTDLVIGYKVGVNPMSVSVIRRELGIEPLSTRKGWYSSSEIKKLRQEMSKKDSTELDVVSDS